MFEFCWPFPAEFSLLSVWADLRANGNEFWPGVVNESAKRKTNETKYMKTADQIEITPSVASRRNLTTIPAGAGGRSETVIEEESDAIRLFQMANVPEAELTELRRRIKAT